MAHPVDMTDAEECAERLRRLAAEPDTREACKKIDAWIDVYRVDGGLRVIARSVERSMSEINAGFPSL